MRDALGRIQSVLLIGGSSEIGLAIVRGLPRIDGASVCLAGPDRPEMEQIATALGTEGFGAVRVLDFDACAPTDPKGFVANAFATEHDVVIVATGYLGDQATASQDPDMALRLIDINFRGLVPALVEIGQRLKTQGHGTLVVMSTVAGERPRVANYTYGAAKAGLDAFTRGLAASIDHAGVQVLVVRPGFVRTRMTAHLAPVPFSTSPDKVAEAVTAALGGASKTIWVPGILRWVMRLLRALPESIFRRLPA